MPMLNQAQKDAVYTVVRTVASVHTMSVNSADNLALASGLTSSPIMKGIITFAMNFAIGHIYGIYTAEMLTDKIISLIEDR